MSDLTLPCPPMQQQKQDVTGDYIRALSSLGDFRYNLVTDMMELNGHPLTENLRKYVESRMFDSGYKNERVIDFAFAAISISKSRQYHPIVDYLEKLPENSGGYFDRLCNCFDNQDGLFPLYLRKWMLGAISKVIAHTQNPVLILDGPQNIGKSLFVRWLCSDIPKYFYEGEIEVDDKDTKIRLAHNWIFEVAEFGRTMRKADRDALKNIITLQEVKVRPPYGKTDIEKPVIANFIGTINNSGGFLDDPTGSRRFLVCSIQAIDWKKYASEIDIRDVWSEIYQAFMNGEKPELTEQEQINREYNNRQYEIPNPIIGFLEKYCDIDTGNPNLFTSTQDLLEGYGDRMGKQITSTKAFQMELSGICLKLGLTKGRQNGQMGYFGIKIKP